MALEAELALRADALDARWGRPGTRPALETLYLGGGTPSLLPGEAIARLRALVGERFGLAPDAEVSLEVNPGPDERGDPAVQRRAGVTRLSIGAQSLEPDELRRLGRRHEPGDVVATVEAARAAGIGSIGLDLLYDLPGQTLASWDRTLDAALGIEPDHLSLYVLTLDDAGGEPTELGDPAPDHLPVRRGARRWRERARSEQDDDRAAALYEHADARLARAGYAWYEISNWARPGHRSRHNLAYWHRRPYEAVGPGAHAFDGLTRRWTGARLDDYLDALAPRDGTAPRLPPGGEERIDGELAVAEATILALRLDTGLTHGEASAGPLAPHIDWALAWGMLAPVAEGRLALTTRGRLLSNELFARLV